MDGVVDFTGSLRRALIAAIKADATCVALQDDRCFDYVPTNPKYPYTRVEYPFGTPYAMSCGEGSELVTQISGFTSGDPTVLSNAILGALDDEALTLDSGYILSLSVDSFQVLQDQLDQTLKHLVLKIRSTVLETT